MIKQSSNCSESREGSAKVFTNKENVHDKQTGKVQPTYSIIIYVPSSGVCRVKSILNGPIPTDVEAAISKL